MRTRTVISMHLVRKAYYTTTTDSSLSQVRSYTQL
nr:MAG TPA: hypothetical protein [Caudoviricetes sp.]